MIVLESKSHRRLAGRLGDGAEIVSTLLDVCRNHNLGTAEIRGIGYLRNATLSRFDTESGTYTEDEAPTGPAQVLSLLGNVSRHGEGPSLHLMVQLVAGKAADQRVIGGRLVRAEVVDLEFFIDAVDDFGFVRTGPADGLAPWLQIDSERHVAIPEEEAPSRGEFLPGRIAARPEEGEPDYELRPDDTLNHPALGPCVVVELPDEDRARIRVEKSERIVELHLGLLRLERRSRDDDGRQHFRVTMRRRS